MQEYWCSQEGKVIKPFSSVEDIYNFFAWLADRVVNLRDGIKTFVKHQQYIAKAAEYHGYISWDHKGDTRLKQLKDAMGRKQLSVIHITRPVTNRDKSYLSMEQVEQVADLGWSKTSADDGLLLQQFVATEIFAMTRPGHSLDVCRVNVKLTNPADGELYTDFGTLRFCEVGTAGGFYKMRTKADSFSYELSTLKPSSLDAHAAHGARLVHDYLRLANMSCSDGRKGGLAEMIKQDTKGMKYTLMLSYVCICVCSQHSLLRQFQWRCLMAMIH